MDIMTPDETPDPLYVDSGKMPDDPIEQSRANLVTEVLDKIREDKEHYKPAFKQMRRDMFIARNGRIPEYPKDNYKANLAGRHVKQKTAALYAKNPKVIARRRDKLDFQVWDENPKSLELAMQTIQTAEQLLMQAPKTIDPTTGQPVLAQPPSPQQEIAFQKAQAIVQDFQQGTQAREQIQKIGKTLETLFEYFMDQQKPVDFKTGMKKLVRRATTTGVGYVELAFQRDVGPRPATLEKLADFRARLDHLRVLAEDVQSTDNPISPDDPEIAELTEAIAALQAEEEIVLREGLIVEFHQSTKIIPDKLCQSLVGFVGCRHVTIEYLYTPQQVREVFDVDLENNYTGYQSGVVSDRSKNPVQMVDAERDDELNNPDKTYAPTAGKGKGLVCVYKHYDKASGLVYYVADGYKDFLREPASPDVFVEDFWPLYALTFNDVEDEANPFPPSDVFLMTDQQHTYNISREGKRKHRKAALPRYVHANGALEKEDAQALATADPFTSTGVNLPPGQKIGEVLEVIPVPGVDPNLYDTGEMFTDIQLVVGSSEAQFGGTSQATATESAIAANSSSSDINSGIDDLDAFLTVIAHGAGQILMREMSPEQVTEIAGIGAVWPEMSLSDIANELYLEVEAGSTGKPNQAQEVRNWTQMLPFLLQMPGIDPVWLARETIRRLDDKADLTEALTEGLPSIIAQNGLSQLSTGNANTDPNAQGGQGGQNAPKENEKQGGSQPSFGSNQVGNAPA